MITKLNIKNMRGLNQLSLENINQLTLFSGENNVGKSTLLESIFILLACYNPDLFIKINAIRGLLPVSRPEFMWEHLFYRSEMDSEISISCEIDGKVLSVSLERDETFIFQSAVADTIGKDFPAVPGSYPLKISCNYDGKQSFGHYVLRENGMGVHWKAKPEKLPKIAQYISPRSGDSLSDSAELFGKVELIDKKEMLIDALRLIDKDIVDISTILVDKKGYLYVRRQNGTRLPLFAMGDGINRLTIILCSLITNSGGVLLLDEIENGMHYSVYDGLWKTLERIAIETQTQLFITTHSYECIKSAVSSLQHSGHRENLLSYVRLGRKGGDTVAHMFSAESLSLAMSSEMEIR